MKLWCRGTLKLLLVPGDFEYGYIRLFTHKVVEISAPAKAKSQSWMSQSLGKPSLQPVNSWIQLGPPAEEVFCPGIIRSDSNCSGVKEMFSWDPMKLYAHQPSVPWT